MLPAPLTALLDHFHALGAPLFLSPIRTETLPDVLLRLDLARVDYAIVPMGCATHIVSDDARLAVYTRELVAMLRAEHVGVVFRVGRGRVVLSERWAAIACRAGAGHGIELATMRS